MESITNQFNSLPSPKKVEIIISDDNSSDNTEEIVKEFQKRYHNIRYYKNKKNVGSDPNIIKSASYAKGNYIWFFGDDDLHYPESLKVILEVAGFHPDAIICNLDLYSKDGRTILDRNLLHLEKDVFIKTKKELFSFFESKFFLPLDWYITCMSNTIVSKKLFDQNRKYAMQFYNPKTNNFLHSGLIYYKPDDYSIYIINRSLAKFRADNRSFGPKEELAFLTWWYKVLNIHNNNIVTINKKNISPKFVFLLALKNLTRSLRLVFLKLFRLDISKILIKLFPTFA